MKTQFQLSMLISFTLLMASLLLASATVIAEKSVMDKNQAQERVEMEMEMEKRTHQPPSGDEADKTREKMRTTEEIHKEKGMESGMTEPAQETKRKWWEFWK